MALTLQWGLHESRSGCQGFLSVIFGGECREEVGLKGKEGGIGEQRTGTIIILHFLNIALLVEYLLMSLN